MRVLFFLLLMSGGALAGNGGDPDKYKNVPPDVREWFRGVRSPRGVPCCDVADGYRVDWRRVMGGSGFEVYVAAEWRKVPVEAVVSKDYAASNPTGDGVVWYVDNQPGNSSEAGTSNRYFIRCFVPGADQ
jgi:hypothetical protein